MITSLLDTDLYKLTMGQAVLRHYDRLKVQYKFINRGGTEFPPGFALALRVEIQKMHEVGLTQAEREFLTARCGHYLREMYIDWLSGYRFNPDEVRVEQRGGKLFVTIE